MDDPAEARRLVESIRSDLGIDESDTLSKVATIAENSLRMLSEELYSSPARFLLELIQNADDNIYAADVSARLSIVHRTDGFLWFGCNERGFSEANLRALCTVSESTKRVEGNRKGYIGEKGIGFKSCFKVADIVWISSGALCFKFDKNRPLGMVAPIWDDFKTNALVNERTMFCFRIANPAHQKIVHKDVSSLETELLLFLRQLRYINITVQAPNGTVIAAHQLERRDNVRAGFRITELSQMSKESDVKHLERFVVCQHTARNMPFQQKRVGVVESDLLVAFPVDEDMKPKLQSRRVYNFLPIRSYGLPFVLQADFVLAASREDIQQNISWNEALMAAICDLFIESVRAFNKYGLLKYSWPQYLKSNVSILDTAFGGFFDGLIRHLRRYPILQSEESTLERPADLQCIRGEFLHGSRPLFCGSSGMKSFAHHGYTIKDLSTLGIQQQTGEQFMSLLQGYVKKNPVDFRQQSAGWHASLAAAIMITGANHVRGLNIIPLRNGKWVSAKAKIFFPDLGGGTAVPQGIDMEVVDDVAAKHSARRALYSALGVSTLNEPEVFSLILHQHGIRQAQVMSPWPVEDIVQHAWFLFRAKTYPREFDITKLLVASQDEKLRHGKDVSLDMPDSRFSLSKYLGKAGSIANYLHDCYMHMPRPEDCDDPKGPESLRKKWLKWLHDCLGVRLLPRLSTASGISPEFDTIIKSSKQNEWLQLLCDEWDGFGDEVQAGDSHKLRAHLAETPVLCLDGQKRPLKDVYVPNTPVPKEPLAQNNVPTIVLRDPHAEAWHKLGRSLQMRTARDWRLYIIILNRMRDGLCKFTTEDVQRMYKGIALYFTKTAGTEFRSKPLVYIASPKPSRWVSLQSCRWEAPASIVTLYALHKRYKQCAELFQHRLDIPNATAQDVVGELIKLSGRTESLSEIRDLVRLLALFVGEGKIDINSFPGLRHQHIKVLPVRRGDEVGLQAFFGDDWFIADEGMTYLLAAFQDRVFFADAELLVHKGVRKLFEKLGLLHRLLDRKVEKHVQIPDEGCELEAETEMLRSKAEYLARIAEVPRREDAMQLMLQCQVWVADTIVKKRYVIEKGKRVYGTDEKGEVALQIQHSSLQIWVTKEEIQTGKMPYSELFKELGDTLGIPTRNHQLAMLILDNDDLRRIEQKLEDADYGRRFTPAGAAPATSAASNTARSLTLQIDPRTGGPIRQSGWNVRSGGSCGEMSLRRAPPLPARSQTLSNGNHNPGQSRWDGPSLGPRTNVSYTIARSARKSAPVRSRVLSNSQQSSSSAYEGASTRIDTSNLTLAPIHLALRTAFAEISRCESASPAFGSSTNNFTTATQAELAVGAAGEAFMYELLKEHVGIEYDAWTSSARAEYGYEPFGGDEAEFADFTITDAALSAKFCNWLREQVGLAAAANWLDTSKNFHVEVKTTTGGYEERFELSANQCRLAKDWHFNARDELLIFRVFNIRGKPDFHVFADPIEVKKDGVLTFETKAGYYVWPA